jgi:hypothetical protein
MGIEIMAFCPGTLFDVLAPILGVLVLLSGSALVLMFWGRGRTDRRR